MILVDTPGIGDKTQEQAAKLMLDYLPDAFAIVFVLNVASSGGIQTDRVLPNITHHAYFFRSEANLRSGRG